MLLLGMLAWVARYFLFAYGNITGNMVYMLYGGILLHGICYDFFFVTGQIYVNNKAPESIRASAQGFLSLVTYGAGMVIGGIVAGRIAGHYKIVDEAGKVGHVWQNIWLAPAIMAAVVMVLFLIFFKDKPKTAQAAE
jgi:MFS family permease